MTINEKARAYDEALEKAKRLYEKGTITESLCHIFPELKESEDEKVRKELIIHCRNTRCVTEEGAERIAKWIAWLEKQGEQKSIWHNEDEEPQRDSLILLIMQSGTPIVAKIIEPNHTFNHGEKWAYIDDLLEKNRPQGKSALESWKDMRLEVYQQASGNRHEPNYSDDATKMFSLNDIDEIFEKIAEKKELKKIEFQDSAWSEEDEHRVKDTIYFLDTAKKHYASTVELDACIDWLKSLKQRIGG